MKPELQYMCDVCGGKIEWFIKRVAACPDCEMQYSLSSDDHTWKPCLADEDWGAIRKMRLAWDLHSFFKKERGMRTCAVCGEEGEFYGNNDLCLKCHVDGIEWAARQAIKDDEFRRRRSSAIRHRSRRTKGGK
ncbi:hypothetical protein LCGC14_0236530 [marine sediment metagenome]|uniref:Uncharacterized protein n=1 Tax=marine sediment metagenome TaxID=412755 RepID=A0A0F9U9D5_9ZZZZ